MLPGLEGRQLMYRLRGIRAGEMSEILLNSSLYFAAPNKLNDRSEAQPSIIFSRDAMMQNKQIRGMVLRQMEGASFSKRFEQGNRIRNAFKYQEKRDSVKETLTNWFRNMLAESSLCCFFQEPRITHWAHYGANSKGFCLAFDRSTRFKYRMPENSQLLHYGEEVPMQAEPITYVAENEYPTIDMDGDWKDDAVGRWEIFRLALLTKFSDWSSENELRVIRPAAPAGLQRFDPSSLRAIVVGADVTEDFLSEVKNTVAARPIPLAVYKTSIVPGKFQPVYEKVV